MHMMDLLRGNKILIGIVVFIVAGAVLYGLSGSSAPQTLLNITQSDPGRATVEAELVASLLEVRAIRLDGQIFNDPAFRALRDFSTQIVPEPIGRDNPFAPLLPLQTTGTAE